MLRMVPLPRERERIDVAPPWFLPRSAGEGDRRQAVEGAASSMQNNRKIGPRLARPVASYPRRCQIKGSSRWMGPWF